MAGKNQEFERVVRDLNLRGSDLQKLIELMNCPNYGALRLFLVTGQEKSLTAQWMADYVYTHRAAHNCYKNDCFCIAQHFNLNAERKKESSSWVIENGMGGYFESVTHGGFRLSDLLYQIGALDHQISEKDYIALTHPKIKKIANKLGVTDEELAHSAENVINWCLSEGYKIADLESTFCASTFIDIYQAEELARIYLPEERQTALKSSFEQVRINMQNSEKRIRFGIEHKSRI